MVGLVTHAYRPERVVRPPRKLRELAPIDGDELCKPLYDILHESWWSEPRMLEIVNRELSSLLIDAARANQTGRPILWGGSPKMLNGPIKGMYLAVNPLRRFNLNQLKVKEHGINPVDPTRTKRNQPIFPLEMFCQEHEDDLENGAIEVRELGDTVVPNNVGLIYSGTSTGKTFLCESFDLMRDLPYFDLLTHFNQFARLMTQISK